MANGESSRAGDLAPGELFSLLPDGRFMACTVAGRPPTPGFVQCVRLADAEVIELDASTEVKSIGDIGDWMFAPD